MCGPQLTARACEVIIDECLKGWKELEYEVVPMPYLSALAAGFQCSYILGHMP